MESRKEYWHKEISRLTFMIGIPQLISAPVSVIIMHFLSPSNVVVDILEILDFFVISFPLTLAVALIAAMVKGGESNPFVLGIFLIIGAGLLSNLLHKFVASGFPQIDVARAYHASAGYPDPIYHSRGISVLLNTAVRVVGIYWRQFGPIMFIQAVGIGIYCGVRYFNTKA